MTTTRRWRALRWFRDHEADINAVMGRCRPSARMRNLMVRELQLERVPIGSFGLARFVLTPLGEALLANKHKTTRSSPHDCSGSAR